MKRVFRNQSCVLLLICFLSSSCLKNSDETVNGPKSEIAVRNFLVTGNAMNVWWDNEKINDTPLEFGSATGASGGVYSPVGAGLHSIRLTAGNISVYNKNFSFEPGARYSLFAYDSLQNEAVKVLLLKDDTATIDTLARLRFLQFIPGPDTLTLVLINNNTGYRVSDAYIGSKSLSGSENEFSLVVPPANYNMLLQRKNTPIAQFSSFNATGKKIYSLIARGVVNGTGVYQPGIEVVQHN